MANQDKPSEKTLEDEPLYRFSWRRFVVITIALLTLPLWAPWIKRHVGLHQMLLLIPFVVILAFSIWCISFMFPSRSIRQSRKENRE
jgi:O-antigen/teichoic acid export membrane protein